VPFVPNCQASIIEVPAAFAPFASDSEPSVASAIASLATTTVAITLEIEQRIAVLERSAKVDQPGTTISRIG
jgi:hypothetical protein